MPEIEAPELELDDDAPTFRRRLALVVVLVTLFGAGLAYLHESNGNLEDNAARDAQIASIKGFGQQVGASTEIRFDYRVFVQTQLLERRQLIAVARKRTSLDPAQASVYAGDSTRWSELRDAIARAGPVTDDTTAIADESNLQTARDEARLSQQVFSNKANDYGNKADSYVAVLTVLAVALFLIGLSLTVSGRGRYLLALPGVAIAIVCVVWTAIITAGSITQISPNAIHQTAQGRQLEFAGDLPGALKAYKAAVDDSPAFGAAWARLGDVEFQSGVKSQQGQQF